MIGVIHYGLGPIGALIAQRALARPEIRVVGAIDIDPGKVGKDLGLVVGWPHSVGVIVQNKAEEVLQLEEASVVLHAVVSSLPKAFPQLENCLQLGKNVISTCEELVFPWKKYPHIARQLDALARRKGVRILGTGINPGFVIDLLPIVLSGITSEIKFLEIQRIVDLRERREALRKKMGVGLTLEEFSSLMKQGESISLKHVGLEESTEMIAHALGWSMEDYRETVRPILVGDPTLKSSLEIQPRRSGQRRGEESLLPLVVEDFPFQEFPQIKPGQIIGLLQEGIGVVEGKEVLRLTLRMQLAPSEPGDRIHISSERPLDVLIKGIHGDSATANIVVNAIPHLLKAPPGLLTMKDLPPISWRHPPW